MRTAPRGGGVIMAGSSSRCVASSSSRAPVKKQRLTVRKEPARGELFEPRLPRGSAGRALLEQLSEAAPTVKCEPSSSGLVPGLRRYTCKKEPSSSSSLSRRPLPRADKAAVGHFLPGPVMLAMPWPRLAPKAEAEASEAEAEAEAAEAAEAEAVDVAEAEATDVPTRLPRPRPPKLPTLPTSPSLPTRSSMSSPSTKTSSRSPPRSPTLPTRLTRLPRPRPPSLPVLLAKPRPRRCPSPLQSSGGGGPGALRGAALSEGALRGAHALHAGALPRGGGGGPGALRRQASRAEARTEAMTEAGSAGARRRRQASRAAATASEPRAGPSAWGHPAHRQRPRRVTGMMMPHLPSLASLPA